MVSESSRTARFKELHTVCVCVYTKIASYLNLSLLTQEVQILLSLTRIFGTVC